MPFEGGTLTITQKEQYGEKVLAYDGQQLATVVAHDRRVDVVARALSVNNPDSGSATEEIEVDYDSAPMDIGFNSRYLLEIAQQLGGDTALIKLADPGSPTIIMDREGAQSLYVLMPLRV